MRTEIESLEKPKVFWPPVESMEWPESDRHLLSNLQPPDLPRHIAIIMDGNGRWARRHGMADRIRGHEAGIESVREIVRACGQLKIEALTLYAFSKENWRRPDHEVSALMRLLDCFLVQERAELMENGVKLETIGKISDLSPEVQATLAETKRLTAKNQGLRLVLALSYGARDEILRATREAASRAAKGELDPNQIDDAYFASLLDTARLPDPDLLIRTSGEVRISNFLLWQIAYAELYMTQVFWPDFRRANLLEALIEYKNRDRRFGRVNEPTIAPADRALEA